MRRRTTFALAAGAATAAVVGGAIAWSRSEVGLPGLPKPVTGMFPSGMAYMRWGTGPKTLLWIVGGPGLGFPIGPRVALIPLVLRPFAQAGYTCWLVNRKRDMPEGYTIAAMAEDHAALIAGELGGKVDVVLGEDFGGLIGFHLAARHPARLDFLASASTGYALTERGKAIDRDFAALVAEGRSSEAWARMLSTLAPDLRPPALVRASAVVLDRLFTDRSRPDFAANLVVETAAEEACDARAILPDILMPVLLIGGDQGPFLSRGILEETARLIPDCTLQLHEGKSDMAAVSAMQLPRDILTWVDERSQRPRPGPTSAAPIIEEGVPAPPATVPEPSLAGASAG